MRHTDVIRGFTPDIVRTESLYVPGKTPVEAMTTEELFRGMCYKSQKMISACLACPAQCSFGREIIRRCTKHDGDEQEAHTE